MPRDPRLLFVTNDTRFFLSHRLPLATGARKAGYDVHVATPQRDGAPLRQHGFTPHVIPLSRRGMNPVQEAETIRSLMRLYRRLRPDLVHHLTIKPVLYGGVAAKSVGVPAVVHAVTGLGYVFIARGAKATLLRAGIRRWYKLALSHPNQRVIFQNPDDRRKFLAWELLRDPAQAVLIRGSGVDLDAFPQVPEPPGRPVVVLGGRILWDKGVGEFVEAARILGEKGVDARFALVGDVDEGNPAAIPQRTLEAWRDEGLVEWWGWRKDMAEVLARSHVACLPSYGEGLPKFLLEAAASGRPLVATDMPGCREVAQHRVNGLLVPARDAHALAAALEALISDGNLRARMGRAGRRLVETEFSQEGVVDRTLQVYRTLLDGSRAGREGVGR